ncbi:hypothetical protein J2129_000128 [Methanofollis sp. W23]|nr:hypothetical protein [Methanofollis sp. W23]MBP2144674.1 hypothetical protein [Methanofollis sp. W23]
MLIPEMSEGFSRAKTREKYLDQGICLAYTGGEDLRAVMGTGPKEQA